MERRHQPQGPAFYANAEVSDHHLPSTATPPETSNRGDVRYRECLKNHAANMGSYVVDGCREFMPRGEEEALRMRCAACDCHRNFHRKEAVLLNNPNSGYQGTGFVVSLGGNKGGGDESSSEDPNMFQSPKKRFRTKFSQEQKDRMQELAEKLGWRTEKEDEEQVQRLCNETGVKRQVFKVWMHNNKQAMKKKKNITQIH